MRIIKIDDEAAFSGLREEWNGLLARSASNTIFLTWEWMYAWWQTLRTDEQLWILAARDEGGALVGLAPLCRKPQRAGRVVPVRALRFIGDGTEDSDYLDFITARGLERPVLGAMLEYLQADPVWDILSLAEVPETSPNRPILCEGLTSAGVAVRQDPVVCASALLPHDWRSYLAMRPPRLRTRIRALLNGLAEGPGFSRCPAEELDARLHSLFDLHARRWGLRGKEGAFARPARRAFYQCMGRYFLEKDWLRFYSLARGGQFVAHQFCFEYDGRLFLLQEGFDPDWREQSVGIELRARVFQDVFQNPITRGVREYDFLGGITRHKADWGAAPKHSFNLQAVRPRPAARLYSALPVLRAWAKKALRRAIPDAVLQARRRWRPTQVTARSDRPEKAVPASPAPGPESVTRARAKRS